MKTKTKQTPRQILEKTGRKLYVDEEVLATAPVGEVSPVEFFNIGKYISCSDLEKEYTKRGLVPADLASLASAGDVHDYMATQWKDKDDKWCYAYFRRWNGERYVGVDRYDNDWDDDWWFAGLRKSALGTQDSALPSETLSLERAIKIVKEAGLVVYKPM